MPFTLDVQPPLLSMGGVHQQMAADRLAVIAAGLDGAGAGVSGGAGDPGLAATLGGCCGDGAASLRGLSATVGGLATNLEAASRAYTNTDLSVMPGR